MSSSDENEWLVNVGTGIINSMERVINFLDAPSDEDEADSSHPKIRRVLFRDRFSAHELLMAHYFNENPVYDAELFRRRFRMRQPLFLQLVNDLANESEYFRQRPNARGDLGFTPLQKCSVAVRQLAYGSIPDSWDEYFQMSERVARESLDEFCRCIVKLYTPKYLRKPTFTDVQKIYAHHAEVHGFPGMLGSLDCLHWEWSSCPNAWQGQYTRGDKGHPTVILEAVATQDLWIWHAFFGAPGSNNDINVLDMSPLFNRFCNGSAPECLFQVNGVTYKYGYYLVDGIYPEYVVFAKTLSYSGDAKRLKYKKAQERARKDVERAFGALKKRWHIIDHSARPRHKEKLAAIMYTCIILHNVILEDEGKAICTYEENESVPTVTIEAGTPPYVARRMEIHNNGRHFDLRSDLIEHIYRINHIDLNSTPPDNYEVFID